MRHKRDRKLETAAARRKLPVRKRPYWTSIGRGIRLGFRRNEGPGSWIAGIADGKGGHQTNKIADADDVEDANGQDILNYWGAQDRLRTIGRPRAGAGKARTFLEVVQAYKTHLLSSGSDPANATRLLHHLTDDTLSGKTVALLAADDLIGWRARLAAKVQPATVNRTMVAAKAALARASLTDSRITVDVLKSWRDALSSLSGATTARRAIVSDAKIRDVIRAARGVSEAAELFLSLMASVGARPSQIWRLTVADLQDKSATPRLMMPSSKKGRAKQITHVPVAIPQALAQRLRRSVALRMPPAGPDTPLLPRVTGRADEHIDWWNAARDSAGLDPSLTAYSLRHSSIVRQILGGVPLVVVCKSHDTSAKMIEAHYARYILDAADKFTRSAMLDTSEGAPATVTPIR